MVLVLVTFNTLRSISLMRTHTQQCARSEYHTQLAKMSFEEIFDLTTGVYFHFHDKGDRYFGRVTAFSGMNTIVPYNNARPFV